MQYRSVFTGISVAMVLCSSASLSAETLAEALELAYQTNPSLASQQYRARAADERESQADAAYGPSIDAEGSYTYTRERSNGLFGGDNDGTTTSYSVTLTQPLLTFGRLAAGQKIANAERLAERERLRLVEQTLIAETVLAYVGVKQNLAIYGVRLQIAALLDEQYEISQKRFELRAATATDVEQIDNQRQIARALAEEARANLEASANEYRRVIGRFPGTLEELPKAPTLPPLEALLQTADQVSPQIRIAAFSESAARQLVALRRADRAPTVSAVAGASRDPLSTFNNQQRALRSFVGVTVNMPIYRGGQFGAGIREADQLASAARFDREEVRRTVRSNASSNYAQAQAALRVAPVYAEAVRSGEEALLNARRQELAGLRTSREILDITNDLLLARLNAISAAANGYTAATLARFEAGLLAPEDFGASIKTYDPDSYDPFEAGFMGLPLRPILAPIDRLFVDDHQSDLIVYYENAYGWETPQPKVADTVEEASEASSARAYDSGFPEPRFVSPEEFKGTPASPPAGNVEPAEGLVEIPQTGNVDDPVATQPEPTTGENASPPKTPGD